jgi:low affinity Fe/Cu permease
MMPCSRIRSSTAPTSLFLAAAEWATNGAMGTAASSARRLNVCMVDSEQSPDSPDSVGVNRFAPMNEGFRRLANSTSHAMGSPVAFVMAVLIVLGWAITGPIFSFSDSWQLVINTGTTVVTFLMVFLIQATQNRDAKALHLKLDELIRSHHEARNIFADLENASEEELQAFQTEFQRLRKEGHGELAAAAAARERRLKRSTKQR